MGWDGFDSIDVIMEVEDTFGIEIPDREAERILTAGALHEYVVRRVPLVELGADARCLSAVAFHRMRRRLVALYGLNPRRIRPGSRLEDILPEESFRWEAWKQLGSSLGVRLAPLEHPRWLSLAALLLMVFIFIASLALLPRGSNWGVAWVAPVVFWTFFCPWLLLRLTRDRYAVHIPRGYETVGDVSSLLMHEEVERMADHKEAWWTHEVWEFIRCCIAKSAGIPPARVKKESKFYSGDLI